MAATHRIWAPESSAYDAFFKAARGDNVHDLEKALTPAIDISALHGDGFEGQAALHMAALYGTMETIEFLLAHGADVNILDQNPEGNYQPLHMAAYRADPNIVKLLLDSGSERDRKGMCERTPLHMVLWGKLKAEPHHIETITLLLDYGLDVNESGALYQATFLHDLSLMQLLLDRGACLEPLDETDPSILSHAAAYADYSTVHFLLNRGATVDTPIAGVTSSALHSAAGHGKLDVFKLLLAHADEDTISKNFRALHMAASSGHASLVELMLNRGFGIEAKDHHDRYTPLHCVCAASKAYPDVVRLLLSRGADVDARNQHCDTALHAVACGSDPEVVKLLLDAGADPHARNLNDQTPLLVFASKITSMCANRYHLHRQGPNPRLETFKLLLAAGSDVNAKDVRGRTALHELAMRPGCTHMNEGRMKAAELLMQGGIEVEAMDADGKMAWQMFIHQDNLPLAKLLLGERINMAACPAPTGAVTYRDQKNRCYADKHPAYQAAFGLDAAYKATNASRDEHKIWRSLLEVGA